MKIRKICSNKISNLFKRLKFLNDLNKKALFTNQLQTISLFKSDIDIITIAFNDAKMIEYQIKLIKKNIVDNHKHIIADNSQDIQRRKEIEAICIENDILYYSIPFTDFTLNDSHAFAIHWSYKNIIRKRDTNYFGFIDHDIFPMRQCTLIPKFKNEIYGRVTNAYTAHEKSVKVTSETPYWSLWAGFFFLNSSLLKNKNVYSINFFPKYLGDGLRLDTLGGLWDSVFSKIEYPKDSLSCYSSKQFRETLNGNIHTDCYENIDEWMHIGNLSNWYNTPKLEEKYVFFIEKLEHALNFENFEN